MRGEGANNDDFQGVSPVEREFLFEGFVIGAFAQSLWDCGGCVVYHTQPSARYLGRRRSASESVELRPFRRATVKACLFTHKLVGTLLPFSGEIAIGEMLAVKAMVGSAVGAIEDGEGEARKASDMYFVGSQACRGANRVIVGVSDVRKVSIPVILVFVADHG